MTRHTRSRRRARRVLGIALASLVVGSFAWAPPASAATITVNTTVDEYDTGANCSLREATVAANTDGAFGGCATGDGNDTITIPAGVYTLTKVGTGTTCPGDPDCPDENISENGDLDLTDPDGVTVQGAGMNTTFVDGNGGVVHERVFDVREGNASFQDLAVRNGNGVPFQQRGGGIFYHADGLLTILRSSIHANDAYPRGGGVGVGNGDAEIIDSEISNNEAACCDGDGGGIYVDDGYLLLQNSSVLDNYAFDFGGGIKTFGDGLEIVDSTISGNAVANGDGGGLWVQPFSNLVRGAQPEEFDYTIEGSTISDNTSAEDGGGMFVEGCCGYLGVFESTFSNNSAQYGGGIFNATGGDGGELYLENSTVSHNYAHFNGGGIYNSGLTYLSFVTLYRNRAEEEASGGGFFDDDIAQTVGYENSILAKNTPDDCEGSHFSDGYNLLGDSSCDDSGGGDVSPDNGDIDPGLAPLRDNGGPTKTHELLPWSPAVDLVQGAEEDCPPPATDQRGLARPTGAACDAGAYEIGSLEGPPPGEEVGGVVVDKALCRKQNPTILGTLGPDRLVGTNGPDIIQGLDARDVILGKGGDDIICGSLGNDLLKGQGGDDWTKGLRGDDTDRGGPGTDKCVRGPGEDEYFSCENIPNN